MFFGEKFDTCHVVPNCYMTTVRKFYFEVLLFKGAVSPDFLAFFYFMNRCHLAPDKQVKMVLLQSSFCKDIREKFDSAQC